MKPNPDFLSQVKEVAQSTDTILVMCRSGGRSAMAVNQLAEAGFRNVYNITDGMEGDAVEEPGSVFQGQRSEERLEELRLSLDLQTHSRTDGAAEEQLKRTL